MIKVSYCFWCDKETEHEYKNNKVKCLNCDSTVIEK